MIETKLKLKICCASLLDLREVYLLNKRDKSAHTLYLLLFNTSKYNEHVESTMVQVNKCASSSEYKDEK